MNEMEWIVAKSLKYRYLVIFTVLVLIIFGISTITNMPIDVFPEFAPPQVEIQTPSLGLSSAEVEALITIPLEEALAGTPGLDIMRSKSVEQLSSIRIIFESGTDVMEARQLVQERLSLATPNLPTWAAPPQIMPPLSSTARTVKIGISSDIYSVTDLSMITYWKIRQRLLQVSGVANVAIWGERIELMIVQTDPQLLANYGVPIDEVFQVTSDALDVGLVQYSEGSTVGTGGYLETPNQRFPIRHVSPLLTAEHLTNVSINDHIKEDGTALRLGDVGETVVDNMAYDWRCCGEWWARLTAHCRKVPVGKHRRSNPTE